MEEKIRAILYGMQSVVKSLEKEQFKTATGRAIRVESMIKILHTKVLRAFQPSDQNGQAVPCEHKDQRYYNGIICRECGKAQY